VVLASGLIGVAQMVKLLQDKVKSVIAPFKYPRSLLSIETLPETQTGKTQYFRLAWGRR